MAQLYALDLRLRAVAAVKAGTVRLEVQRLFRVARSTLARWVRTERAGSCLTPDQGKPGFTGQFEPAATLARLQRPLEKHPDERPRDPGRRWQKATGKPVSEPTRWRGAWQRLSQALISRSTWQTTRAPRSHHSRAADELRASPSTPEQRESTWRMGAGTIHIYPPSFPVTTSRRVKPTCPAR